MPFSPFVSAVPDEMIPLNNGATIRPQLYGARTYGELMCARQTLSFVRLARIIADLGTELTEEHGTTQEYARALSGYAAGNMIRKIRRSTRGSALEVMQTGGGKVGDLFGNESTISYHYDFF